MPHTSITNINVHFSLLALTDDMRINEYSSTWYSSSIVFILVVFGLRKLFCTVDRKSRDEKTFANLDNDKQNWVPFFYVPPSFTSDGSPPFLELYRTLERYKNNVDTLISAIILSRDVSRMTEREVHPDFDDAETGANHVDKLYSSLLEKRVQQTALVLELDYFVLQDIVKPFQVTLGLTPIEYDREWIRFKECSPEKTSSYDSAFQIITHIVRDWSEEGRKSRNSLYGWSISELLQHGSKGKPVLVPGSGLGRLARDASLVGFDVEANELSITMSAAAYQFLNENMTTGKVHPFAFDFLLNEVDSARRYQPVFFPDRNDQSILDLLSGKSVEKGSLSYTIGDFVEIYTQQAFKAKYGAILTCFFIDTASNIMEYILTIRNVLIGGGVWINVGPLQWHENAKLHPSGDELKVIVETMGFRIKTWSVDDEAINYRHDDKDEAARYTKYEGYRPLRFVAILESRVRQKLDSENAAIKVQKIRRNLLRDKRFWNHFSNKSNTTSQVTITELS